MTDLQIYIQGLEKLWWLWAIIFLGIAGTGFVEAVEQKWERSEKLEKKTVEKAAKRDKLKRIHY